MSSKPEPTNSDLSTRIDALASIVEKQSKIIAQTGQKLIEMQLKNVKLAIAGADSGPQSTGASKQALDAEDFITNEDIVQLVGELQGQLDELEERSIRRTFNIQLEKPDGLIAPLLNKEGDIPGTAFPTTVEEFAAMDKVAVIKFCVFYDVIVPEGKSGTSADNSELVTEEIVDAYSQEEVDSMHDELARFMGLKFRKGSKVW